MLYVSHGSGLVRLAYLLTGDRDAAEDITHEAFAKVGARLFGLKDPDKAGGYLYRTVVNLSRGYTRGISRQRKLEARLRPSQDLAQPSLEDRDEVFQILLRLPQRQRAALYLRHYLGLNEAGAAEILGISTSAMKSLTHRATEACRTQMREEVR